MDSFSEYPSEYGGPAAAEPQPEVSLEIGGDERRMHVRAYNYWCSLLEGRDYPSIEDLEPGDIEDFGPHSVLLDFTEGRDNPATPYIGTAIREECGIGDDIKSIADVPGRSLLSRLTDHYMQIIANRAPVGFEAEFVNQRSRSICYRGILMPFSSDGDTIDFIYGVINWKDLGEGVQAPQIVRAVLAPLASETEELEDDDVFELGADESHELGDENVFGLGGDETHELGDDALELVDMVSVEPEPEFKPELAASAAQLETEEVPVTIPHLSWEDGPLADPDPIFEPDADEGLVVELDSDAGLADRLWAARESAEVCKQADGRSRVALYRALAMAYDFAVATRRVPEEYSEILEDAGVKSQARAPMTPIVKLVFGIDYDKTRLTEFAAALNYAERRGVDFGAFQQFVEEAEGGLKGLVAEERKARRPDKSSEDKVEVGKSALRSAPSIPLAQLPTNQEFALVLTRRNANGVHEVVELVADTAMLNRALRRAVK